MEEQSQPEGPGAKDVQFAEIVPAPLLAQTGLSPVLQFLIAGAAAGVILLVMRAAAEFVMPVILAAVITVAVSPLLSLLMRHRVPPVLAWLITLIVTVAAFVFVVVLAVGVVAGLLSEAPHYVSQSQLRSGDLVKWLGDHGIKTGGLAGQDSIFNAKLLVNVGIGILKSVKHAMSMLLLTLLLVIFMLVEATNIQLRFATTPPRAGPLLRRLESFTRDTRAFVQSTTVAGLLMAIADFIFLAALDVKYALIWGVFAFFMSFIPGIGFIIALIPPTLIALLDLGWQRAIVVFLGMLVINAIIQNAVRTRLVATKVNLSPVVVLISVLLWGWVLGIMGGLLAVPMTLLVRRVLLESDEQSSWMSELISSVRRKRKRRVKSGGAAEGGGGGGGGAAETTGGGAGEA